VAEGRAACGASCDWLASVNQQPLPAPVFFGGRQYKEGTINGNYWNMCCMDYTIPPASQDCTKVSLPLTFL